MASSTLKFGPEWLRNLSDGSVSSAPSSSAAAAAAASTSLHSSSSHSTVSAPKYKLAEFRYGREEMLALFSSPVPVPEELKDVKAILSDRLLQPLALQPETDDEQLLFSQPVNSSAVLRMTGRGSSVPLGLRGDVDRGRGRGRGRSEGGGFYSRASIEEDSFPRGRHPKDGHDAESRGRGFGYTGRSFDDMSTSSSSVHGEFSRSMSTENWRNSRKYEDSEGSWRKPSQRSTSRRWREPWEKSCDGDRDRVSDRRMSEDLCRDRSVPTYRRSTSSNFAYDEESDPLPEWSVDDVDDIGTFDSSGAFMSLKELEQQENKDKKSQEADHWQNGEEDEERTAAEKEEDAVTGTPKVADEAETLDTMAWQPPAESASESSDAVDNSAAKTSQDLDTEVTVEGTSAAPSSSDGALLVEEKATTDEDVVPSTDAVSNDSSCPLGLQEAEVNFDHLELQVESLYASMSADEETLVSAGKEKGFLPPDHEDAKKWFYRDPQGQVQGPFSSGEMAEWFSAGYFSRNLVVKQGSDDCFVPLGELIKKMGSVPFIAAPVKISPPLGNSTAEMQQMQQDQLKLLLMQQQQQQQQQQQALQQQQQLQHQLRNLQEPFGKVSPAQQQLLLQLMLKQHLNPQMAAPTSQQQKPVKAGTGNRLSHIDTTNLNPFQRLSTTSSLLSTNVPPSFHRSLSQPSGIDVSTLTSSLLYGLNSSAAAGTTANLPSAAVPSAGALWRSSSNVPSAASQNWLSEAAGVGGGGGTGLWNAELPKTITAAELEEMQYLALEKAHQQQQQSASVLKLQELLAARTGAEKQRDTNGNGTGGVAGLDQIRELLQQQKQQMDIVRLAEEQRRLLDEKRRILELNPQRLIRQDRSDELYRQQQLETLCRLPNDPIVSSIQERDALDVRQLMALQQAQPWATAHSRSQMTGSGTSLATPSGALFHQKDSSSSSSILQQDLLNKHLKLNEVKASMNQWPVGSGSSSRWGGETGTWGTSLPSKSPLHWDTATAAANNKTINSSVPFVPGGVSPQLKQEFIQKLAKLKEDLMHWCENVLKSMLTCSSMDIPTFIHHLMGMNSPVEVNQFVQMYLGDTDDAKKFVKQFVEKQSRMQCFQQEAFLMQYMSSGNPW